MDDLSALDLVGEVNYITKHNTNYGKIKVAIDTLETQVSTIQEGTGTVTSVDVSVPTEFQVTGGPVTSTGVIAISTAPQAQNSVWAGPASGGAGAPGFRTLDRADIPSLFGTGLTSGEVKSRITTINTQSANYTFIAADSGVCVYHPASDTAGRTWTIPANSSVAYPVGTIIEIDNDHGAGAITLDITTDTLVLVGSAGSTGTRTIASGGRAVIRKVAITRWRIWGDSIT